MTRRLPKLKMLPAKEYVGVKTDDPIRFYHWPVIGKLYRRRVELCLAECLGGERILEVGFGSGVTFMNLHEKYKVIYGLDLTAKIYAVKAVFEARQIKTFLQNGNVLDMPYADCLFDTVLLISVLEHLKPDEQPKAFQEIWRVLKPGGQLVYGVPVERPLMTFMFRLLGYDIHKHHFSTEKDVKDAARKFFGRGKTILMNSPLKIIYQVGSFTKKSCFNQ